MAGVYLDLRHIIVEAQDDAIYCYNPETHDLLKINDALGALVCMFDGKRSISEIVQFATEKMGLDSSIIFRFLDTINKLGAFCGAQLPLATAPAAAGRRRMHSTFC